MSATLAGVLAVGMVPAAAFAADQPADTTGEEGIELQTADQVAAFTNGSVSKYAIDGGTAQSVSGAVTTPANGDAQKVVPTEVTLKAKGADDAAITVDVTDAAKYTVTYKAQDKNGKPTGSEISAPSAPGKYVAIVTATAGDYEGASCYLPYQITAAAFNNLTAYEPNADAEAGHEFDDTTFTYTGSNLDVEWFVTKTSVANSEKVALEEGTDYTVKYYYAGGSAYDEGVSIKDAGTYYVVLEGLGKYAGQKVTTKTITVSPFGLVTADVTVDATTTSTAPKHPTKVKASDGTELDPSLVDLVYTGTTPYGTSNTAYTFKAAAADGVNPATGKKTAAGADFNVTGEKPSITVSKVAAIATFGYDEGAWQDEFSTDNSDKKPVRFDVSKIKVFDADGEEVEKGASNYKYDVAVYTKQSNGEWGTQAGTTVPTAAGTYKVVVTVNAVNNEYKLGGSAECVVTVTDGEANADASVYVTYGTPAKVVTSVEKTFDGQAITADSFNVTAVKAKDSAADVQITKKLVDAKGKDVSTSGATNAGEYTLVITSSNYNLTGTTEIPVTVKAVDLTDLKLGDFVAAVPAVTDKDGHVTTPAVAEVPGIAEHNGYTYIVKPAAEAGSAVSAYTLLYNTGKVNEDTGKVIYDESDNIPEADGNIDLVWEKYNTKKAKWETVTTVKDEGTYRVGLKFKGAEANAVNYTFLDDDATYVEYEVVDQAKFKFDDVQPSNWFFNTVYEANKAGYVFGIGNSKQFGPNLSITRADVAVIIARMAGVPTDPSAEGYESFLGGYNTPFSDVESGAYYAKAVAWAAKTGIVTGYGDTGEFKPEQAITREEFATMLARYAEKVKGADITADASALDGYADAANVSDWAKGYVAWAVEAKAMGQNTDMLWAGNDISRAEAATMAVRYQPAK